MPGTCWVAVSTPERGGVGSRYPCIQFVFTPKKDSMTHLMAVMAAIRSTTLTRRGRAPVQPRTAKWKASLADTRRSAWHQHPHL